MHFSEHFFVPNILMFCVPLLFVCREEVVVANGSQLGGTDSVKTGEQSEASRKLGEDISTTEVKQDKRYKFGIAGIQMNMFCPGIFSTVLCVSFSVKGWMQTNYALVVPKVMPVSTVKESIALLKMQLEKWKMASVIGNIQRYTFVYI